MATKLERSHPVEVLRALTRRTGATRSLLIMIHTVAHCRGSGSGGVAAVGVVDPQMM